jgi:hypothetical protein
LRVTRRNWRVFQDALNCEPWVVHLCLRCSLNILNKILWWNSYHSIKFLKRFIWRFLWVDSSKWSLWIELDQLLPVAFAKTKIRARFDLLQVLIRIVFMGIHAHVLNVLGYFNWLCELRNVQTHIYLVFSLGFPSSALKVVISEALFLFSLNLVLSFHDLNSSLLILR